MVARCGARVVSQASTAVPAGMSYRVKFVIEHPADGSSGEVVIEVHPEDAPIGAK